MAGHSRAFGIVVSVAALLAGPAASAQDSAPDLVIYDAKIVTVDEAFSIAEAAAIKDGRFVLVSSTEQVLAAAGPQTRRVDLDGLTVLPGFNDTHMHLVGRAISFPAQVDLTDVSSIAEIQQAIAAHVARAQPGEWIFGSRGWWEYELSDGRLPTRYDLDEIAPDNPVAIPGPHYRIVNSLALERLGITRDTEDPPGGEIWKDDEGEPTGLLMDNAARGLRQYFPELSRAEKLEGIRDMIARVNAFGLTSYREPGGDPEGVSLLRELYEQGELTIRVDWTYSVDPNTPEDELEEVLQSLGPPGQWWGEGMFRADGLAEVGLDGAEETALLRGGYPGRPEYKGLEKVAQDQLNMFAATAARHGWRLGPHAVGDAAIDQALEAFAYANKRVPIAERRWMIDHAFLLLPDHYADVRELGVVINSQYMHNYQLGKLILDAWERPLADMSERFRDWVEHGIVFANGSDGPISYHAEPLLQIYGAITRQTGWGGSLGPDQGLSREDAIRSVTINSAYTSFEEHVKGSIEPGKYADFVVLSEDILTVAARDIKDIEVLSTVLAGETVYGSLDR